MIQERLHILIAAALSSDTERLVRELRKCTKPAVRVTVTPDLHAATAAARDGEFDLIILDAALAEAQEGGLEALSPTLLSLPIVIALPEDSSEQNGPILPEGVEDYIVPGHDDADVLQRVLRYANRGYATIRSLKDAELQLRTIVEGIGDGVVIVDTNSVVLFANPASESILSRELTEMIGAKLKVELPASNPGNIQLSSHQRGSRTIRVQIEDIIWEGRPAQLISFRDYTAQADLERTLRKSKEDAERVANLKTAFLANMSHELRMPLASIIGFAQLIRDGLEHDEFREFAESIIDGGNRLLETITSVLDLTRLDANAIQSQARLVSASAIAREAAGMLGALASKKNLPLEVNSTEDDDTVFADPTVLRRILNNLIGNAIKFTDRGHVRVTIDSDEDQVIFRVEDTGIGIEEEFMPLLFEEFTQESAGYDRSHEGSGLALANTTRLCALIDAEIKVDSEKGVGTTFTVAMAHADDPFSEDPLEA